jgi:hypothetical protein
LLQISHYCPFQIKAGLTLMLLWGKPLKEVVVVYFKGTFLDAPGRTDINHKYSQLKQQIPG